MLVLADSGRATKGLKMNKKYCKYSHTHVMVAHPKATLGMINELGAKCWEDEGWKGPQGILLHTDTRVWIAGSYCMIGHSDVKQIGDGGVGFDEDGNCILSVPVEWCSYMTVEEAEHEVQMMDIDSQLLSYAI